MSVDALYAVCKNRSLSMDYREVKIKEWRKIDHAKSNKINLFTIWILDKLSKERLLQE